MRQTHTHTHSHTCRRLVINTSDNIDPYCKEFKSHDRLPGRQAGRRSHLSRSSYEPSDIARYSHTRTRTHTPAIAHCQNAAGDAIKVSATKRQSGSVDIAVASVSASASAVALLEIVVA